MKEQIISRLRESADLKLRFAKESLDEVQNATEIILKCFKSGGKLLVFGNGGSAADAQHIAAEFVNRFNLNRPALPCIALTTDTSLITSICNDDSFKSLFSRQIEALGKKGDVAIGITTGGKSTNVINGLNTARSLELKTIGLIGNDPSKIKNYADCLISIPSDVTARIQELHITVAHIICELIEDYIYKKPKKREKQSK
ncbi:MAG: D-sedoheptulose 7-phosphate isomerase [Thermodesulfobacteriota bacterium]